jgi:hypothetical protein
MLVPCRAVTWRVLGDDDDSISLVADDVTFHPTMTGYVDDNDLLHAADKWGEPGWIITGEVPGLYAPADQVIQEGS